MESVEIIMLPVADRQKAKEFYKKLGFEIIVESPAAHGETWIQMGIHGCKTTISLGGFHGIICETKDIDANIKELATRGIQVGNIDETPWGKFAWLKDLDGNSLCLHEK